MKIFGGLFSLQSDVFLTSINLYTVFRFNLILNELYLRLNFLIYGLGAVGRGFGHFTWSVRYF